MGANLYDTDDWLQKTPAKTLLGLFQSRDDVGYCAMHCWALVLSHSVVHALYWYVAQEESPHRLTRVVAFYEEKIFDMRRNIESRGRRRS